MLRSLIARIVVASLFVTSVTGALAAPAQAAFTPMERTSANEAGWTIVRQGDAAGDITVPAEQRQVVLTGNYKINPARIAPLVVGDVLQVRFEVTGGFKISAAGGWRWQRSQTPANDANRPLNGISYMVAAVNNTAGYYTYFVPGDLYLLDGSGTLNLKPVLYINGVEQTGTIEDNFSNYAPVIEWLDYSSSYTVNANDVQVIGGAPLCLDRSKFNGVGGGSLTRSLGIKRGGVDVTGATSGLMDYVYTDWKQPTGYVFPAWNDVFWMNIRSEIIKVNDASSDVVTGDVLTMTPSLTHSTIGDVLGACPRLSTTDAWLQGGMLNFGTYAYSQVYANCEYVDTVTGRKLFDHKYVGTGMGVIQTCGLDGLEVGHTYRVTARQSMYFDFRPDYQGGNTYFPPQTLAIEDFEITMTRPTYTEPVLPGHTGPGAVMWASQNNDTDSNPAFMGRANAVGWGDPNPVRGTSSSTTDNGDGVIVASRSALDKIRVEHWGPYGRYDAGSSGKKYIEFTDPVADTTLSQGESRGGTGWYANGSWYLLESAFSTAYVTTGTWDSDTTSTFKIKQSTVDQACRQFYGNDTYASLDGALMGMNPFSMPTATPSFKINCAAPDPNKTGGRWSFETLIVHVGEIVDGYATLEKSFSSTPAARDASWVYMDSAYALNYKSNIAAGDIAGAFISRYWDNSGFVPDYSNNYGPGNPDRYALTILRGDGTVEEYKNWNFPMTAGYEMYKWSIGFDANGKLRILTTSMPDHSVVSLHHWELFSIATDGTPTNLGEITLSEEPEFRGDINQWGSVIANPDNNDLSVLYLATGVGDDTTLYVSRSAQGKLAYSVINLATKAVWSGEAASTAISGAAATTTDNEGNMFLYGRYVDDFHYSVIRWGIGEDPTAEKSITSSDSINVEHGSKDVETATTNITTPTWSIDGGANSSLFTIDPSTGKLVFKAIQPVGDYVVIIKATNGTDTATQTVTVHVRDTTSPDFEITTPNSVEVGNNKTVTPTNVTESGTFTVSGSEAGLFNVNPTTGAITFKNPPSSTGTHTVTLTLTDASGNSTSKDVVFEVTPDLTPPVVNTNSTLHVPFSHTSVVTLEANEESTWSIDGGIDAGLFILDGANLKLTGETPPGTYHVTVKAVDGAGNVTTKDLTVIVLEPDSTPPVITVKSKVTLKHGVLNVVTPKANEEVTWSNGGGSNGGLFNVNAASGKVTLKRVTAGGNYRVILKATDLSGNASTKSVEVVIKGAASTGSVTKAVWFKSGSAKLDRTAQKRLLALLKLIPKGAKEVKVVVTGWVQQTPGHQNDVSLSRQRARNVLAFLRAHTTLRFVVAKTRAKGIAGDGPQARYSRATITFNLS